MNNIEIGKYLLQKRKEKGLTQAELANELGVTYQAVSRWENGDSIPDIQILDSLAKYYNVSIDEILQREFKQLKQTTKGTTEVRKKVAILMLIVFNVFNILGISLFIIFGFMMTPGSGLYDAISIICLIMFTLVAHIGYNVYYYIFTKKERFETLTYRKGYMIFFIIVLFLPTILLDNINIFYLILFTSVSLISILYSYFLSNKYIESEKLSEYLFRNNKRLKVIIVLIIILIIPINPLFMFPFVVTALTQIILFSFLALR